MIKTTSQEDDGKQEGNIEPIMEAENNNDDIKEKEDQKMKRMKNILKNISSLNLWFPWKRLFSHLRVGVDQARYDARVTLTN